MCEVSSLSQEAIGPNPLFLKFAMSSTALSSVESSSAQSAVLGEVTCTETPYSHPPGRVTALECLIGSGCHGVSLHGVDFPKCSSKRPGF